MGPATADCHSSGGIRAVTDLTNAGGDMYIGKIETGNSNSKCVADAQGF